MIIFLYGADTFRSKEKLKILKERFIQEVDKSGLNLADIEAIKMSIADFNKTVASRSFLAKKRMVVIRHIFKTAKSFQTEVLELLKKGKYRESRDDNVLIFWDEEPDKRVALFKYLSGSKFKEEFNILANNDLVKWIEKRVELKGGKISHGDANFLASKSDGDLWALAGEIDKLVAAGKGAIGRAEIEESSLVKIDDNIFNLTDAIANQDRARALKLLDEQIESGVNEIYLLSMIVRSFRILTQIKSALEGGGQGGQRAIAGELGLHPFVVQKAMPQARKYEMDELKRIYAKLLEIDIRLKTSDANPKTLLEMFVVEISR